LAAVPDVSANVRADRAAYGAPVVPAPVAGADLPPCPVKPVAPDHTLTLVLVGMMLISFLVCAYLGYAGRMPKANGAVVGPEVAPSAAPASGIQGGPVGPSGGPGGGTAGQQFGGSPPAPQ